MVSKLRSVFAENERDITTESTLVGMEAVRAWGKAAKYAVSQPIEAFLTPSLRKPTSREQARFAHPKGYKYICLAKWLPYS